MQEPPKLQIPRTVRAHKMERIVARKLARAEARSGVPIAPRHMVYKVTRREQLVSCAFILFIFAFLMLFGWLVYWLTLTPPKAQ